MRAGRNAGGSGWLALLILLAGIASIEALSRSEAGEHAIAAGAARPDAPLASADAVGRPAAAKR